MYFNELENYRTFLYNFVKSRLFMEKRNKYLQNQSLRFISVPNMYTTLIFNETLKNIINGNIINNLVFPNIRLASTCRNKLNVVVDKVRFISVPKKDLESFFDILIVTYKMIKHYQVVVENPTKLIRYVYKNEKEGDAYNFFINAKVSSIKLGDIVHIDRSFNLAQYMLPLYNNNSIEKNSFIQTSSYKNRDEMSVSENSDSYAINQNIQNIFSNYESVGWLKYSHSDNHNPINMESYGIILFGYSINFYITFIYFLINNKLLNKINTNARIKKCFDNMFINKEEQNLIIKRIALYYKKVPTKHFYSILDKIHIRLDILDTL